MSIKLMAQAWGLRMPPGPKLVLLSLADEADDNCQNDLPVSIASLSARTSLSESEVRRSVRWLGQAGVLRGIVDDLQAVRATIDAEAVTAMQAQRRHPIQPPIDLQAVRVLREAAQFIAHGPGRMIWSRRMKRLHSRLDRDYRVELGRDLWLRVWDTGTALMVCEAPVHDALCLVPRD